MNDDKKWWGESPPQYNCRELADRWKGAQSKTAYCPACKYYGIDCHVDEDEWTLPCDYYEERSREP